MIRIVLFVFSLVVVFNDTLSEDLKIGEIVIHNFPKIRNKYACGFDEN